MYLCVDVCMCVELGEFVCSGDVEEKLSNFPECDEIVYGGDVLPQCYVVGHWVKIILLTWCKEPHNVM